MQILLIHRYFWPDTPPYASMLLTIAKQLVSDGHDVEVLTSFPSYKSGAVSLSNELDENIEGVKIKRIHLFKESNGSTIFKLLNMFYFPLRILTYILLHPKIESVMSSTAPPVVTGFSSALGAKLINAKFIYHCMDIHPEIGKISGEFKNPIIFKFLLKLDQWSCNRAERVIVLSNDMKKSLIRRNNIHKSTSHEKNNINIINNFALSEEPQEGATFLNKQYQKKEGDFRILFAGNIGRFQMLESYIDAMFLLEDLPNVELVFLGEGAALNSLKKRAKGKLGKTILFFPHQNIEVARKIISEADLGIVSLLPNIYRYALPSKTMTYLSEGCPLLITVEAESELVMFVTKNQIGVTGLPENPGSIAEAIRSFIDNKELTNGITKRCKHIANEQFSKTVIMRQWTNLYKNISRMIHV